MNYIRKARLMFFVLPLISLILISCKISDSDGQSSNNPVNVGIIDIDSVRTIFGNACEVEQIIINTEGIPDGTLVQFGENSADACLIGANVTVEDGVASVGFVTDYVIGVDQPPTVIPVTVSLLLDDGSEDGVTLDQFANIVVNGIGFIPPVGGGEDGSFDVEALASDSMEDPSPVPFIFGQQGLTEKLDEITITVTRSNMALGTVMATVLPDGTIQVEYTPTNGTEGVNVITLSTQLTTDPAILNACDPGTVDEMSPIITASITINQTAAESGMVTPEDCTNSIDDDEDGFTDCADQDCDGMDGCDTGMPETICDDGIDNNGTNGADCDDPNCQIDGDGSGADICFEASCDEVPVMDEDGDTPANCADEDCDTLPGADAMSSGTCEFGLEMTCDDDFDNDANTFTDCDDPNCQIGGDGSGENECFETLCADGIDNDDELDVADGADCLDMDCNGEDGEVGDGSGALCEFGTEMTCDDGFDNDGMEGADCADTVDCPMGTTCGTDMECDNMGMCIMVGP